MTELLDFENELSSDNIEEFENLKREIVAILDDREKARLNQINFYSKVEVYEMNDDLPF